jgi:hypothetical protein
MPFMRYSLLLSLISILLGPAWLSAGPVLMGDPYPVAGVQPTKFVVEIDGISRDVLPEKSPDGRLFFRYDLGQIADGVHTARIKAVNSVVDKKKPKESVWVTISFRKTGSEITRIKDESEKLTPTRTFKGYLKEEQ